MRRTFRLCLIATTATAGCAALNDTTPVNPIAYQQAIGYLQSVQAIQRQREEETLNQLKPMDLSQPYITMYCLNCR